eukprot:scaffold15922_cov111-Isochrysis_galbana.AAC.6
MPPPPLRYRGHQPQRRARLNGPDVASSKSSSASFAGACSAWYPALRSASCCASDPLSSTPSLVSTIRCRPTSVDLWKCFLAGAAPRAPAWEGGVVGWKGSAGVEGEGGEWRGGRESGQVGSSHPSKPVQARELGHWGALPFRALDTH